jgi:hypothetical protein
LEEYGRRISDKAVRETAESSVLKKHIGYVRDVVTHDKLLAENRRTVGYVATYV